MNIRYKLLLSIALIALIFSLFSFNITYCLNKSNSYEYMNGINNLLLIGVDNTNLNDKSPCYCAIIITINSISKNLKLTSLCKDTLTNIPGIGVGSLSESYLYGGEKLLVKTIKSNFDINIDNYVVINKTALIKLIESIGNISFDNSHLNGDNIINLLSKHSKSSIFLQEEIQRNILQSILYNFAKLPFTNYPNVIAHTFGYVKLNITPYRMLSLGFTALSLNNYKAEQLQFPLPIYSKYTVISNNSYLVYDKSKCISILKNFIYK